MPSRKGKDVPTPTPSTPPLPFARYTSVVGVHTSLLAFSALLLPTSSLSVIWNISNKTDRPQRDVVLGITENPVRTVAWICVGAFILQSWWGSWVRAWLVETHSHTRDGAEDLKLRLERQEWQKQRVVVFGKTVAMTLAVSLLFHALAVLLGAPITSHWLHTYSMSLLLAILTVLPPAYALGAPSFGSESPALVTRLTWIRLFAEFSPRNPIERALVYPTVSSMTGCWVGVIPIALDWERPWQVWPLTPTYGAVGGFIVGSLVALVVNATLELARADRQGQQAPLGARKLKRS